ncbi:hypothetical protein Scep_027151 [Stephania cephalantha]|uniref:Uncharacterized protein n=1 Tax=Stephania cephalantha TaxID=152367 RepID=A0AAP0HSM5_9MAGN
MADSSSNSDKEDSEVDAIIAQAKDLVVLEQISSLNLSGLSDDSVLPTDLETRFRKLKSFPQTRPRNQTLIPNQIPQIHPKSPPENPEFPDPDFDPKPPISSPSSSSGSCASSRSRSPIRDVACCFWRSPKTAKRASSSSKKKRKENDRVSKKLDLGEIESGDLGFLSELSVFTEKERKRSMRRLAKEEEKINREAEKIVRWAKKVSARMNGVDSGIVGDDDEFEIGSDEESVKR